MAGYIRSANVERIAQEGIKVIMGKLEAGNYQNEAYENADRTMLALYLNGDRP